jgi:superfamily II RNA helicase
MGDVLVSAPTGSGRPGIAIQAIRRNSISKLTHMVCLTIKGPFKFLYEEFKTVFGPELCGILTGERKENTDAPVIVAQHRS